MLKENKNYLLKIAQEKNIDLSRFTVEEDGLRFSLNLTNSPVIFVFEQDVNEFDNYKHNYTLFSPGFPYKFPELSPSYESILTIKNEFMYWLEAVVKRYIYETEMPDLWEQFQSYTLYVGKVILEDDFEPFTKEQQQQIKMGLVEYKKLITDNYDATKEQLNSINERLEYLSNAVERLNKFDWKGVALSTITSIAINLTVDTNGGRLLFRLFEQAMGTVFRWLLGN